MIPSSEHIHNTRRLLAMLLLTSVILSLFTFLIPEPDHFTANGDGTFTIATLITSFQFLLYVSTAILFLYGLRDFKPRLQKAYQLLCISLVLLGLNFLQYPIINLLNVWDTPWYVQGWSNIPFIIALLLTYAGLHSFANIVQVRSLWNSPIFLFILIVVVCPFGILSGSSAFVSELCLTIIAIANASLVLQVKKATGAAYNNALAWLFIALVWQTIVVFLPAMYELTHTEKGAILGVISLITAFVYMRAGYAFNKITSY